MKVDERPERAPSRCRATGSPCAARSRPAGDVVGWVYSDPGRAGSDQHHTAHCAIADMTLTVLRRDRPPLTLTVRGGATYELGMREHDHGIPIQPFSDP